MFQRVWKAGTSVGEFREGIGAIGAGLGIGVCTSVGVSSSCTGVGGSGRISLYFFGETRFRRGLRTAIGRSSLS